MRFLTFDSLITPSIIRLLFYLSLLLSCLAAWAVDETITSNPFMPGMNGLGLLAAIVVLVASVVLSRIFAEMILVLFMIRDELAWQRQNQPVLRGVAAE